MLGGQSIKSKNYCDVSPNRLHDDGCVRKDERNHEEQQKKVEEGHIQKGNMKLQMEHIMSSKKEIE